MCKNMLVGINSKYVHTNLAVRYLKRFTEAYSDEKIEIYESNINNNLMKMVRDIGEKEPEKIFFSTYITITSPIKMLLNIIHNSNDSDNI